MNGSSLPTSSPLYFTNELNVDTKEIENSMKHLNPKNKQEIRDLFHKPSEHLIAYELTDENLACFRKLSKYFF